MPATARLPIVQSIPHGGLDAPPEVGSRLALSDIAIYNECDLWVDDLYNFALASAPAETIARVTMPIARAIIDANRPPTDLANPDGPIKVLSSYGEATFDPPLHEPERTALLDRYWQPFHTNVASALEASHDEVRLLLDCHSMAQRGPSHYAFAGAARPLICIANLGDERGEIRTEGPFSGSVSAPAWFLLAAGEVARTLFADVDLLEPDGERPPTVALNWPFAGGYIVHRYSALANGNQLQPAAPWSLMVEVNRGIYVGNQNADSPIAPPNLERIALVRDRLAKWASELSTLMQEK